MRTPPTPLHEDPQIDAILRMIADMLYLPDGQGGYAAMPPIPGAGGLKGIGSQLDLFTNMRGMADEGGQAIQTLLQRLRGGAPVAGEAAGGMAAARGGAPVAGTMMDAAAPGLRPRPAGLPGGPDTAIQPQMFDMMSDAMHPPTAIRPGGAPGLGAPPSRGGAGVFGSPAGGPVPPPRGGAGVFENMNRPPIQGADRFAANTGERAAMEAMGSGRARQNRQAMARAAGSGDAGAAIADFPSGIFANPPPPPSSFAGGAPSPMGSMTSPQGPAALAGARGGLGGGPPPVPTGLTQAAGPAGGGGMSVGDLLKSMLGTGLAGLGIGYGMGDQGPGVAASSMSPQDVAGPPGGPPMMPLRALQSPGGPPESMISPGSDRSDLWAAPPINSAGQMYDPSVPGGWPTPPMLEPVGRAGPPGAFGGVDQTALDRAMGHLSSARAPGPFMPDISDAGRMDEALERVAGKDPFTTPPMVKPKGAKKAKKKKGRDSRDALSWMPGRTEA